MWLKSHLFFQPKFNMQRLDEDTVSLLSRRAYDVAASTKGVKVFLNGKRIPIKVQLFATSIHMTYSNQVKQISSDTETPVYLSEILDLGYMKKSQGACKMKDFCINDLNLTFWKPLGEYAHLYFYVKGYVSRKRLGTRALRSVIIVSL